MSLVSKQAFVARLVGKWQLCSQKSIFGTTEGGIEFTADHRWFKLDGDLRAGFTRESGFDHEGTWTQIDRSGPSSQQPWQLNFQIAGSGMIFSGPHFALGVPKMRLDNEGLIADYVRVDIPKAPHVWPDVTPAGFIRRAGVQAAFSIDIPKDWKGGWFEGVWDFEPSVLPSTTEDGKTFAITVVLQSGRYSDAFRGQAATALTIEGRDAISVSPDALHRNYAVDWSGCSGFVSKCSSPTTQRLIVRVFASTKQLWDKYLPSATIAVMTVMGYDGSDPAHGTVAGGSMSNAYVLAITRFLDARAEGVGAEALMCCSAPNNYQSIGLYENRGQSIISYDARVDNHQSRQPATIGFVVDIHYAGGTTRSEFINVSFESGQASSSTAPKISSATAG